MPLTPQEQEALRLVFWLVITTRGDANPGVEMICGGEWRGFGSFYEAARMNRA